MRRKKSHRLVVGVVIVRMVSTLVWLGVPQCQLEPSSYRLQAITIGRLVHKSKNQFRMRATKTISQPGLVNTSILHVTGFKNTLNRRRCKLRNPAAKRPLLATSTLIIQFANFVIVHQNSKKFRLFKANPCVIHYLSYK